jgi:hypothetical protein
MSKKFLLAVPITYVVEDFKDDKVISSEFNIVFKPMNKKLQKKVIPKELNDLFAESKQIIADSKDDSADRAREITARILELKDEVVISSFNNQVMGVDSRKLLEFAEENECIEEILSDLHHNFKEIKKKL